MCVHMWIYMTRCLYIHTYTFTHTDTHPLRKELYKDRHTCHITIILVFWSHLFMILCCLNLRLLSGSEVKWKSLSRIWLFATPWTIYSSWNSPGQNTGVGCCSLLQGIFPTQGSNPGLLHCRRILHQLSHKGSPRILEWEAYLLSSGSSWPRNQSRVSCISGGFFTNWAIKEALMKACC